MTRTLLTALRAGLVLLVLLALSCLVWGLGRQPLGHALDAGRGPAGLAALGFDHALRAVLAAVLLAAWTWCAAGTTLLTVRLCAAVAGGDRGPARRTLSPTRTDRSWVPGFVRRLVPALLGLTVAGGLVLPAVAEPVGGQAPGAAGPDVAGLSLPDRVVGVVRASRRGADVAATVVVAPGDSLWRIAERLLPPDAGDHEVTAAWRRIYDANTGRLGADPDRILPGAVLAIPDLSRHYRKEAS